MSSQAVTPSQEAIPSQASGLQGLSSLELKDQGESRQPSAGPGLGDAEATLDPALLNPWLCGFLISPKNTSLKHKKGAEFICIMRGNGGMHVCPAELLPGKSLGDTLPDEEFEEFELGLFHKRFDPKWESFFTYHWPYDWPLQRSPHRECPTMVHQELPWVTEKPAPTLSYFFPNWTPHQTFFPASTSLHPLPLITPPQPQPLIALPQPEQQVMAEGSSSSTPASASASAIRRKNRNRDKKRAKKKASAGLDENAALWQADKEGARPAPLTVDRRTGEINYDYLGSSTIALAQLSIRDIKVIDTFWSRGPYEDDEAKPPFHLRVCFHDTSEPGQELPAGVEDYEEFVGVWPSLYWANQVAFSIGHERHRFMFEKYYPSDTLAESKFDEWFRDDGRLVLTARDKRFYILFEIVNKLPDHVKNEDVPCLFKTQMPEVLVGIATLEITGPVRTRVIPPTNPVIIQQVNVTRHLVNKAAAMLFYRGLDSLILDKELHQGLFDIAKMTEDAWTSMALEDPEEDYEWTFLRAYKGIRKHPKHKGGDQMLKVTLQVQFINAKPWGCEGEPNIVDAIEGTRTESSDEDESEANPGNTDSSDSGETVSHHGDDSD